MFLSAKDCGPISTPLNGTKVGEQTTYPSKIIFTCDDGFNLRGSNVRQCKSDGEWNGVETSCQGRESLSEGKRCLVILIFSSLSWFHTSRFFLCFVFCYFDFVAKDCGIVKIPLDGSIVGPNRTTFPNSLTFTCDRGFLLKGSRVRQCQANATWSGSETYCQG